MQCSKPPTVRNRKFNSKAKASLLCVFTHVVTMTLYSMS